MYACYTADLTGSADYCPIQLAHDDCRRVRSHRRRDSTRLRCVGGVIVSMDLGPANRDGDTGYAYYMVVSIPVTVDSWTVKLTLRPYCTATDDDIGYLRNTHLFTKIPFNQR